MSNDELFEMVRAAYERGYNWGQENPDSRPFLNKAAYDYADKTTSALALRTPSDGVRVKLLEWEEDEPGWWCAQPAAMIGGFGYEVRITDSGKVRARRGRDGWADFSGTLVEAKAAAQADYEQRILSALPTERNRP